MPRIQVDLEDLLKIQEALRQAGVFFRRRDETNAQAHLAKSVRYTALTSVVEAAYDRCLGILIANGVLED